MKTINLCDEKPKRPRRAAKDIQRQFVCHMINCEKAYGYLNLKKNIYC